MKHEPLQKTSLALPRMKQPLPFQTPGEEIANSILHGFGVLLACAGLVILLLRGNGWLGGRGRDAYAVVAYAMYGASMFLLFMASTLYHAITNETAKRIFRIFDHSAIYLLIAGTYTPFCLVPLRGSWGWTLFGIEWGLALLGVTLYSIGIEAIKKIELAAYILMGWAIVVGWMPLTRSVSSLTLVLLISGGLCYTLGTIWYSQKIRRGTHVTWHAFVLAGAVVHWFAILSMS